VFRQLQVISKLCEKPGAGGTSSHIPYRQSKITCMCIYIYICRERERNKEREGEREREREREICHPGVISRSQVISKLCEKPGAGGTSSHIPYRQSKITRLLQNSLGGDALSMIVCNVTPASLHCALIYTSRSSVKQLNTHE